MVALSFTQSLVGLSSRDISTQPPHSHHVVDTKLSTKSFNDVHFSPQWKLGGTGSKPPHLPTVVENCSFATPGDFLSLQWLDLR